MLRDGVHHRNKLFSPEVLQFAGPARTGGPARAAALAEDIFDHHHVLLLVHFSCVVCTSSDAQAASAAQLFIDRSNDWLGGESIVGEKIQYFGCSATGLGNGVGNILRRLDGARYEYARRARLDRLELYVRLSKKSVLADSYAQLPR